MIKNLFLASFCAMTASQPLSERELLQAVVEGRDSFFCSGCKNSPLEHATVDPIGDGVFYYVSGINYAVWNGVMQDTAAVPTDAEIDKAIAYFGSRKLPFMWWSECKRLEEKGFVFGGNLMGIAADISGGVPNYESSVEVKVISSDEDMKIFSQMIADGFAIDALQEFQALASAVMKSGENIHFMAYVEGKPVGVISLAISPGAAGIWNMVTLPEYRKKGVGSSLVHAAMVEAKKRNFQAVMAILMPKGMALGVFTKFGFKEMCQFPFYVYGVTAESLEK